MSEIEFFMSIASVVVAIGIAQLASIWGTYIQNTDGIKLYLPHSVMTVTLLFLGISYWLGMIGYFESQFTRFYEVWFLVIPTVFFVIATYALTPQISAGARFNMEDFYYDKRKPIFFSLAVFAMSSSLADVIIKKQVVFIETIPVVVSVVLSLLCALSSSRKLHYFNVVFVLLAVISFSLTPFSEIRVG